MRDRELKVASRLKYLLSTRMTITSDRNILDMIEHSHLEFPEEKEEKKDRLLITGFIADLGLNCEGRSSTRLSRKHVTGASGCRYTVHV